MRPRALCAALVVVVLQASALVPSGSGADEAGSGLVGCLGELNVFLFEEPELQRAMKVVVDAESAFVDKRGRLVLTDPVLDVMTARNVGVSNHHGRTQVEFLDLVRRRYTLLPSSKPSPRYSLRRQESLVVTSLAPGETLEVNGSEMAASNVLVRFSSSRLQYPTPETLDGSANLPSVAVLTQRSLAYATNHANQFNLPVASLMASNGLHFGRVSYELEPPDQRVEIEAILRAPESGIVTHSMFFGANAIGNITSLWVRALGPVPSADGGRPNRVAPRK